MFPGKKKKKRGLAGSSGKEKEPGRLKRGRNSSTINWIFNLKPQ